MHLTEVCKFLRNVDELKIGKELLNTFSKYASSMEQFDELAMLYEKMKCYPESINMLRKAQSIANEEQMYNIRSNFATIYNHCNEPQKAKEYLEINLQINPKDWNALLELSFCYFLMNNKEKTYEIQKQLLDNEDVGVDIKKRIAYNMSIFQMQSGKFKEGIKNMIMSGRAIGIWPAMKKPYPKWNGEDTKKTLLIYAEGGIGDNIINLRFMNILRKRNINAIWISSSNDLTDLFSYNGYKAVNIKTSLNPFDEYCYIEAMSLPIYLDLDRNQLWEEAYLKPNQKYIDKWKEKLPKEFITLRWSGNPYYDQDLHRSIDHKILIDSFNKFNLPMISLQIDEKNKDDRLVDVDIENWNDTFAIQYLAKFNITSCTSTAHSAAAMNVKTIIIPPIAAYYIWVPLKDNIRSYWYGDNVAIIPQTKHKNWIEPIKKAVEYVEKNI